MMVVFMRFNGKNGLLIVAVFTCGFLSNQQNTYAAEKLQEFVLDPMVVTAQGFATKDLETPALVEVFNEKEIEDSGANNAYDVLQDTLGVTASSYGFNGTNGCCIIRGQGKYGPLCYGGTTRG